MNIVIVDDHPLIRKGLSSILINEGIMNIVGEASNSKEALSVFTSLRPDIAIVDLQLGGESGLELIAEAKNQGVVCEFVVLSSTSGEEDFKAAKSLGVSGYILKESLPEELIHALRMISNGRNYFDQRLFEAIFKSRKSTKATEDVDKLTPKEMEVLMELGKGLSNKEISQILYVTEYTVKKHVSQVLAKLNLADRTQAALYANAKGLVRYVVN
ncbi:response regulator transcription factor [Sporosarcina luteola]|uniref:response regulator n=1 Tax=Sporosarcina luteola TaxID=582850 RepID=UPI00203EDBAC|nr:response regulator transcription factor [Sporosarcina luteola]MCM3744061.1 response regulator transcription factor [Sporosarcina luteola]